MKPSFLKETLAIIEQEQPCHLVMHRQKTFSLRLARGRILQVASTNRFYAFAKVQKRGRVASAYAEGIPERAVAEALASAEALCQEGEKSEPLLLSEPLVEFPKTPKPLPEPELCYRYAERQSREDAAGMLKVCSQQLAVLNSSGLIRSATDLSAHFFLIANGFGELVAPSLEELEKGKLELIGCEGEGRKLSPGSYRVLLGPRAAADLMEGVAHLGFGAEEYLEGRSFLPELKTVGNPDFCLQDDWRQTGGVPFDFEGTTRTSPFLVERGIPGEPVTDLKTAKKLGLPNSGHSLPPWEGHGPLPLNLVLPGGEDRDLLARLGTGLYIPRFHYLAVVNPKTATYTGTVRDCFWVEEGKVKFPLLPLRFTESFLTLLSRIFGRGASRQIPNLWGNHSVPPLLLSGFVFS